MLLTPDEVNRPEVTVCVKDLMTAAMSCVLASCAHVLVICLKNTGNFNAFNQHKSL